MRKKVHFHVNGTSYLLGDKTWLMGVVNITPDSFSDGGLFFDRKRAVARTFELAEEGADIIDFGGESSRPGSDPIPVDEELRRIIPVIEEFRKSADILVSVDTMKSEVAEAALDAGADIINDISALRFDPGMARLAARRRCPVILMHMKGTPKTMQIDPHYDDPLTEIKSFFRERLGFACSSGISEESLVIDPGIGFGKRFEDNLVLINRLSFFEDLERPILVGISRKSFIGQILDSPPRERLEGTIAASVLSVARGAHILRVHDIKAVKQAIQVAEAILEDPKTHFSSGENHKSHVC